MKYAAEGEGGVDAVDDDVARLAPAEATIRHQMGDLARRHHQLASVPASINHAETHQAVSAGKSTPKHSVSQNE